MENLKEIESQSSINILSKEEQTKIYGGNDYSVKSDGVIYDCINSTTPPNIQNSIVDDLNGLIR